MRRLGAWLGICFCASAARAALTLHPVADAGGEAYKLACTLDASPEWPLDAKAELVFDIGSDGSCYAAVFEAIQVRFVRRDAAGKETLLVGAPRMPVSLVPMRVMLARDRWRMRLIANGEVWLTAFDDSLPAGDVAWGASAPGITFAGFETQPTEPIWFEDDFMREPGERGGWQVRSGQWVLSGVSEEDAKPDKRPDPNRSSNPFAFRATNPRSGAVCTTGQWFWDTYRSEVSVRAAGEGTVALLGYYQDPQNYLALRWSSSQGGGERQLVAVRDGQERVLAVGNGGWASDQWYRLGVEIVDGHLLAMIDREVVLTAETDLFGQGEVGLAAEGVVFADFDDFHVETCDNLRDSFADRTNGLWQPVEGRWLEQTDAEGPTNRGLLALPSGTGLAVTGATSWDNYRVTALCKAARGGAIGVVCSYQDPRNYLLLRWGDSGAPSAYRNKLQLVRVSDGQEQVLGAVNVAFKRDLWHQLSLENQKGFIRARIGWKPVFEAFEPDLTAGKAGILAAGQNVVFDQVDVEQLPPERQVEFTERFTQDSYMTDWAQAAGSWYVAEAPQRGGVIWHRGDFYGDCQLAVDSEQFGGPPRTIRLHLAGDRRRADSGYALVLVQTEANSKKLAAEIQHRGQGVRQAELELGDSRAVRFARRGRFLLGYVDDRCVIGYYDTASEPESGTCVGVSGRGPAIDLERIQATSEMSYDTTFHTAPVDWYIAKGVWETINRWKCSPEWSFFGGHNDLHPLIWSKDDYVGAIEVEAYMGIKMDLPGPPNYSHPSDLCITVHGDGKEVLSGTSFLFATRNNAGSSLFVNGKEIARNDSPEARFRVTGWDQETQGNKFHRHWFHVVLRKAEGKITCTVDGATIFDLPDPAPGGQGKVAIYSINNGVMVARLKIWYEGRAERRPFPDIGAILQAARTGSREGDPFNNDFERGIGAFRPDEDRVPVLLETAGNAASGARCLAATNLRTGGTFAVRAVDQPFAVSERPLVTFQCKLPPPARVNLYVQARGVWHVVKLTGSEQVGDGQRLLGAFEGVAADNQWHLVQFNLGEAFKRLYGGIDVQVTRLVFAMREPDPYLHAAFGCNPFGTTWYLDNFRVGN